MKLVVSLLFSAVLALSGPLSVRESGFQAGPDGLPEGWTTWAARTEIAPRTFVDHTHDRGQPGALAVSGNSNPAAHGGWVRRIAGIEPGKWYRLVAHYHVEGQLYEPLQVVARLDWAAGEKRAGQPEYAYATTPEGEWRKVTLEAPAPVAASAVNLQLYLSNAPQATVWWDDISFEQMPTPQPRNVTVASINFRPANSKSAQESVSRFIEVIDKSLPGKTDIILLPEGITIVGTRFKYADVAESVPGPTTRMLGEVAKRRSTYIAAGIYEREGSTVYNTSVLIDREGKIAGKYRKVYIPREEIEGGITPGVDYPVFRTDFGTVGMMICWDVQYADPARWLALRGAELVLMPIWGGNEALGKARAIENHVFVASSGYNYPTYVMDPDGELLATARENGSAAIATIDLSKRYADKWLGNMRARFMKELRLDLDVAVVRGTKQD